ncbi:MAG TPA: metallophosphoesterase, partial [Actinoplanes sp.]|nr:metallophosphoesterase [Actinoplanes sp.]
MGGMVRRPVRALALAALAFVFALGAIVMPGGSGASGANPPELFADGFESGNLSAWSGGAGLAVQQQLVADGAWAARSTTTGAASYAYRSLDAATGEITVRLALRLESISGTSSFNFLKLRTATGTAIAEMYVTPSRVLGLRSNVTGVAVNSPVSVATGVWHDVRLHVIVNGTASTTEVLFDGATVPALGSSTANLGSVPVGRVQVGENVAGRTADLAFDTVTAAGASQDRDPVLAAAGDIACDPLNRNFNGGAGTSANCRMKAVADLVLADPAVTTVAALGDVQYECGGLAAFNASYHPSWGRFKAITRPTVGNHEYIASSTTTPATDCDAGGTAAGYYTYFGAAAGDPAKGYYSYEVGSWHVIVLNTTCDKAGGCGAGSPQELWLRQDLAQHPAACTVAYFHIPLWSSGGRAEQNAKALVTALYQARAELVLTGHDHLYERFAPQAPDSTADPENGIRAFVVGTGGANHTSVATVAANSEFRNDNTYGILKLTLRTGGYAWSFVPETG